VLNRNNRTSHDNRDCNSQEQVTWNNNLLGSQDDAIYDYERVPAGWRGFDSNSNGSARNEHTAEKETARQAR